LAVFEFTISSKRVGRSAGRSAGLVYQIELASAITQRTSAARIACRGIEKANAPLSE